MHVREILGFLSIYAYASELRIPVVRQKDVVEASGPWLILFRGLTFVKRFSYIQVLRKLVLWTDYLAALW